ncbi:MAG: N-acetylmuramoyl-L-alanine amidase [Candidatus Babeliales bacterium]
MSLTRFFIFLWCLCTCLHASAVRIMLQATNTGSNSTYALSICQQIKKKLELTPEVTVIIAQKSSKDNELQELATLANTLSIDLFVSIAVMENHGTADTIDIFTFTAMSDATICLTDDAHPWISYADAHRPQQKKSNHYAHVIAESIAQNARFHFACFGPSAIPYKILQGIQVSACAIECTVKNSFSCDYLIEEIALALQTVIPLLQPS